jgi:hypothetical protein
VIHVQQATDKIARTARRSIDTHVKHALSKPRVVTTLTRMTAMFNFISDLCAQQFQTVVGVALIFDGSFKRM